MSAVRDNQPMSDDAVPSGSATMHRLQVVAGVVAFVVVCFLWIVNCSGPRPSWSQLQVQPPSGASQSYQVTLDVTNSGPGHGEVDVVVRLKSKATGKTYEQDQTVTLESGETSVVTLQVNAPPGQYTTQVDLEYPPR